MKKYRSIRKYVIPNYSIADRPSITGNLIKVRSLGYVSDGNLILHNHIDLKADDYEAFEKYNVDQIPELDFLKEGYLFLMDVLIDRFHHPHGCIHLLRKSIDDQEDQLQGN